MQLPLYVLRPLPGLKIPVDLVHISTNSPASSRGRPIETLAVPHVRGSVAFGQISSR